MSMSKGKVLAVTLLSAALCVCSLALGACNKKETVYYTVNAVYDDEKGTIELSEPASQQGYIKDETVTVTVTALENYTVGTFTVNDHAETLGEGGVYTFQVQDNTTVKATFTEKEGPAPTVYYTVSAVYDDEKGTIELSKPASQQGYIKDERVTVTVTALENYTVETFTVNDKTETLGEGGVYTFQVQENTTVKATFIEKQGPAPTVYYTVTAEYDAGKGTIELSKPASQQGYIKDERVTVTVTALENYTVETFTVNDHAETLGEGGVYTFQVQDNTTVKATFVEKEGPAPTVYYTVNAVYDEGKGTIELSEPASRQGYIKDETVTVTVTALENYTVETFTVNDHAETLGEGGVYTFQVQDNTTVKATFIEKQGPAPTTSIPQKWQGDWTQFTKTNIKTTLSVTETELLYNGSACEIKEQSESAIVFRAENWNYTLDWIGDQVLHLAIGSNHILFAKGSAPDVGFPARFYGTLWNNATLGALKIDAAGKATVKDVSFLVFYTDETTAHAVYNDSYWTASLTEKPVLQEFGGYMKYEFTLDASSEPLPEVESDAFGEEWQGYWRLMGWKEPYIKIGEKSFKYGAKGYTANDGTALSYKATKAAEGNFYTVTVDNVVYTLKLTSDGQFLIFSSESQGKTSVLFFGKAAYDATQDYILYKYATVAYKNVFPAATISDYSGFQGAEGDKLANYRTLFSAEGEKDLYFDDPAYDPGSDSEYEPIAHWGDDALEIVSYSADGHSGTAFCNGMWYTFSFEGDTVATFKLTFLSYGGGKTVVFTEKKSEGGEDPLPSLAVPEDLQGIWQDSDGYAINIQEDKVGIFTPDIPSTEWFKEDGTLVPAKLTADGTGIEYVYGGKTYTVAAIDNYAISTTDDSGVQKAWCNFTGSGSCSLKVGGSYINETTWTSEGGQHTLEIKSFKLTIDGAAAPIYGSNSINTSSAHVYWNNTYWLVQVKGETLVFTDVLNETNAILFSKKA